MAKTSKQPAAATPAAATPAAATPAAATPAAATPAPVVQEEVIEEVVPEPSQGRQTVTFVLDAPPDETIDDDEDLGDEDDDLGVDVGDEDETYDEDLTTAVGQLTQLMMTEEGEALTDVVNGIRDSLEKQNKILYRGLQLLESKFGATRR